MHRLYLAHQGKVTRTVKPAHQAECPECDGAGGDYEGGTAYGYIDGTPCAACNGTGLAPREAA